MASRGGKCLLILTVIAAVLSGVDSRPDGAPVAACTSLTPSHGVSLANGPSPYSLQLSQSTYTPGGMVSVTVVASQQYRGIILQARRTDGLSTAPQGSWLNLQDAQLLDYKRIRCSSTHDTITHTNRNDKSVSQTFTWLTPITDVGSVRFVMSVVQTYNTYWVNVESNVITYFAGEPLNCPIVFLRPIFSSP
ncbi:putative defense protein 3 [Acanthaster planci]|uniref:Defense protein 3 n=1 Tax=Acanthaster planci TaxID=133434 RepID=A0A8B7YUX4_ACAPL|nr:putative defense protein 3 [Acanthaster planci]